jgi:hypothetical protein
MDDTARSTAPARAVRRFPRPRAKASKRVASIMISRRTRASGPECHSGPLAGCGIFVEVRIFRIVCTLLAVEPHIRGRRGSWPQTGRGTAWRRGARTGATKQTGTNSPWPCSCTADSPDAPWSDAAYSTKGAAQSPDTRKHIPAAAYSAGVPAFSNSVFAMPIIRATAATVRAG